ncbi:hypothetical protein CCP2SC5_390025 [Azospirillaceae bacterium]
MSSLTPSNERSGYYGAIACIAAKNNSGETINSKERSNYIDSSKQPNLLRIGLSRKTALTEFNQYP